MRLSAVLAALPIVVRRQMQVDCVCRFSFDNLRCIAENTAKSAGGSYFNVKWDDIFGDSKQDARTAEEIALEVIAKCGLEVID